MQSRRHAYQHNHQFGSEYNIVDGRTWSYLESRKVIVRKIQDSKKSLMAYAQTSAHRLHAQTYLKVVDGLEGYEA